MNHRIVWPIAGLLGVAILALGISNVPAQRQPPMGSYMGPMQSGRFVVAHASEKQIVILDSATGKLYKATPDDFKKYSEMPKMEFPGPFPPDRDKDRAPPKDFRPRPDRDKFKDARTDDRKKDDRKKDGEKKDGEKKDD